jgi:hypothetical protein
MYGPKVVAFFDKLMDKQFAGKPFMRHYLDYYFDLYWDLHLGVIGYAVPFEVRQVGKSFNTVLAYRNPLLPITYENYMIVRERLDFLKSWIDDRRADIESRKTKDPEKTIAGYWLRNAGDRSHFAKKDSYSSVSTILWHSANGATRSSELCRAYPKTVATQSCGRRFKKP